MSANILVGQDVWPHSGLRENGLDARARFRHCGTELGKCLDTVAAVPYRGLEFTRTIGHANGADRTRRPLQRMRERARLGRQGGKRADKTCGLLEEHFEHFALEAGVTEGRSPQVPKIDRTVFCGRRREWHPAGPFQMSLASFPCKCPLQMFLADVPCRRSARSGISPPFCGQPEVPGSQPWGQLKGALNKSAATAPYLCPVSDE